MEINKLKDGTYKLSLLPSGFNNSDLIEERTMFLYNRRKTIGLRKDKKLHKFVGIRDGYTKQLEFSMNSIIIDGVEKVSKNRVNFTSIKSENNKVIHNLSNTLLYNEVDSNNYRNMVKIDENFNKIEITYQVHTKGLRILNELANNKYWPINGQYTFVSLKKNKKIFIIDKPVVIDSNGRYLNIVDDKLYVEDGNLYYKKTVNNSSTNLDFPLFVDANIIFNLSSFGQLSRTSSNTNKSTLYNDLKNSTLIETNVDSADYAFDILSFNSPTYTSQMERIYLAFDTSTIDKSLIYKAELSFNLTNSGGYWALLEGTQNDVLSSVDWLNGSGTYYAQIGPLGGETSWTVDLNSTAISNISDTGLTKYVIKELFYDYQNNVPVSDTGSWKLEHDWSFTLDIYVYDLITDTQTIQIPIETTGFGVLTSSDASWSNTKNGSGVDFAFDSFNGDYSESVGVNYSGGTYTINRTFLQFDTSIFKDYVSVLSSVKLKIDNYMYYNEGIVITKGTQNSLLNASDWNNFSDYYTGTTAIGNSIITDFDLPLTSIDRNGITSLVLISYHDYYDDQPITESVLPDDWWSGIDFEETTLEVVQSPIKVYGQTTVNVKLGDYFDVEAFTNYGNNRDNIMWYRDSGYTEFLSSGSTLIDYSVEYQNNNKIYAILILDENFDVSTTLSPTADNASTSVPLIVTVDLESIQYPSLPEKNINYKPIDIDSIYYKYHKCISGVCYTYVRDINDAYEGFPLVSNSWGNNSYNLYNEFDIIDEFFSNSHDVEVAYNEPLNLNDRYNSLDGVILREGTRVLLMAQTDVTELGVYVTQYDNTLVKTDEMDTWIKMFRYKAQVNAGTYADQEIHIWPILPPLPSAFIECIPNPVTFVYNSGIVKQVSISSNTSWKAFNNIPWISISKSEGTNNDIITLTTTMPNLLGVVRSGEIEFTGLGGATTVLVVIQNFYYPIDNLRVTTKPDDRLTTGGDYRIVLQ